MEPTTVGKLQLVYTNSKLGEIIKFGKNNTRLNSTFVNWGSPDAGLEESNKTLAYTISSRSDLFYMGDFNGDGKTDLVIVNNSYTNNLFFIPCRSNWSACNFNQASHCLQV